MSDASFDTAWKPVNSKTRAECEGFLEVAVTGYSDGDRRVVIRRRHCVEGRRDLVSMSVTELKKILELVEGDDV